MTARRKRDFKVFEIEEDPRVIPDEDAPRPEEKRGERFFSYTYLVILVVCGGLITRLFYLSLIEGKRNISLAEGNRVREEVIRAPRGLILDRNGVLLARNEANYELTVVPGNLPKDHDEREKSYVKASLLIGSPADEIKKKSEAKGLDFFQNLLISEKLTRDKALNMEASLSDLAGFQIEVNPVRSYPLGSALSHILGYAGRVSEADLKERSEYLPTDFIGKDGIEKQYESVLRGADGARIVEVDSGGRVVRTIGPPREPEAGKPVYLTIDSGLQSAVMAALQKSLNSAKKTKGSVVVMDPRNGDILSAVSLPSYDNNAFAHGISPEEYSRLIGNEDKPLFFRAVQGAYPSGSIIKPFIASAGLQEGVIGETTTVHSTGGLKVREQFYPDWLPGGHGFASLNQAISNSINTYFYILGGGLWSEDGLKVIKPGLGVRRIAKYLHLFGFGVNTGVDLPMEESGLVPDPEWKLKNKPFDCTINATADECWYLGDTYNMSIGQGDLSVTPLQMAAALSAIANGGNYHKPHFYHGSLNENDSGSLVVSEPQSLRQGFVSGKNLQLVRQAMRETVVNGSGRALADLKVSVAGKTGTAQFGPLDWTGTPKFQHAWFTSFAPYDNPSVVVVVLIEGAGQGHEFAVPVAREIYQYLYK